MRRMISSKQVVLSLGKLVSLGFLVPSSNDDGGFPNHRHCELHEAVVRCS